MSPTLKDKRKYMSASKKSYKTGVRRFPRLAAKHLISFEYFDDERTEDIEGMGISQNLSLGGVLLEIDKSLRAGATVFLELALREHVIKATARIVHSTRTKTGSYDIGLEFTQIKESDVTLLTDYFQEKGISINPA